ncbi:MAG: hypothetical protein K5839_07610 [Treponemataceae bacterium]|nr:hypothetical protein [Treponemataceae bacterium]
MDINNILSVVLQVLKNPLVIIACVVVLLYLLFVSFVADYRKKPPKPKKQKAIKPPVDKKEEGEGDASSSEGSES